MRTAAVAFILSMLCGTILTPIVRRLAHHFGLLDHALSPRKIHGRPVPRLGGIAIVIGFYAPLVGLLFFHSDVGGMFIADRNHTIGLFVGGLVIALLGLYDDLRGAGAVRKFIVQFLVAGFLYRLGFRIDALANPFGNPIALGWIGLPFTLLWMVGVVNALNLIDGLDGLAGGVALVAVTITFLVSLQRGHPLMMLFSAALAGSIVGFLFYNFNPASIFMGDTGSMFLGFVLAATAVETNQKASTAVAVIIPTVALGLPIMDTLLAIGRRAWRGRPLFQADKEHIHHRLMARGLSHRQAVLVLYGFCVILGLAALLLTYGNSGQAALLLVVLAVVAVIFLRTLGYFRLGANSAVERKRTRALRAAVRPFSQRLRLTKTLEEIRPVVTEAISVFGAVGMNLRLGTSVDGDGGNLFSSGLDGLGTGSNVFRAQFVIPVPGGKATEQLLELVWCDGRREIDRDTEIAVDILCEYLGDAFEAVKDSTGVASSPPPTASKRA
ncbi:MAG TPA: MraY family glycosyltransferase [Polyangia bacterium]|nr:MraY family glycosyltransferase [Polyangia bacterium]